MSLADCLAESEAVRGASHESWLACLVIHFLANRKVSRADEWRGSGIRQLHREPILRKGGSGMMKRQSVLAAVRCLFRSALFAAKLTGPALRAGG